MKYDPFIYGRNQTEGITGLVQSGNIMEIWKDGDDEPSQGESIDWFILYPDWQDDDCIRLDGDLHYKWAKKFETKEEYNKAIGIAKGMGIDHYTIYNPLESYMVKEGVTMYKGMEPKDVSVLSFDIEATGLDPATNQVLMIANTFRNGDTTDRRLFSIDEYKSEKEMIYAWCNYVNDCNPSVLVGHNVFGYDLPFLTKRLGKNLPIGRMQRPCKIAKRVSQFRKDGSQSYDYRNVLVPGREVIDTFHLAIKYDARRRYPSYGLKAIVEFEGLEVDGRQHWDFKDGVPTPDSVNWDKFKEYAEHDADDALALYDLMIPAYFHYAKHIPKTMQQIINGATGSQVNSFMLRAYLNDKHSIPAPTETKRYEGAISFGKPGLYKWVAKVDVASLYPSIILRDKIYDSEKDPKAYFLRMVDYFTTERLKNKELGKVERSYYEIEQAQKIVINSAYGFMGAPGLHFNSPHNAAAVTKAGRDILTKGINWAELMGWQIVNADTDSFSFVATEGYDSEDFVARINAQYDGGIVWEDDGFYDAFLVIKAKNYVLLKNKNWLKPGENPLTIKGSALKASMKEPALKEFIDEVIDSLLEDRNDLGHIYRNYARVACSVGMDTIAQWCSKKTVTKAVLNPKRTNEQRLLDAIKESKGTYQEGDKIHVFFETDTKLALKESFAGEYSKKKLLGKLFKTIEIFKSVVNMEEFPNLTLKRNQGLLEELTSPATGDV